MKLTENTKVTTTLAAIVACICVTSLATVSYVNILNRLDRIAGDSVTHSEFQAWVDSLREANPPLHIPAVPQKQSAVSHLAVAVIARTETKSEQ
jgi:hypothetical protein